MVNQNQQIVDKAIMTKQSKYLMVVILITCCAAAVFYTQYYQPRKKFSELAKSNQSSISDSEWRDACHDCIRWENHHDSYLILIEKGNDTSIPYLIRGLKRMEDSHMCTKEHCIEALETISGKDYGDDIHSWKTWYSQQ